MLVSGWKWWSGIKNGPLPSPTVLWIVNVCEENPHIKKIAQIWTTKCDLNKE